MVINFKRYKTASIYCDFAVIVKKLIFNKNKWPSYIADGKHDPTVTTGTYSVHIRLGDHYGIH
jgi:hypothetical protein